MLTACTIRSIINAVVLSSAWSAGNAFFYSSTRILYASALDGKAPRIFTYEKFGVPYPCVALTTAVGMLAYLNVANSSSDVFFWFSNISAVSTLIVWCSINITYLRFYYGLKVNGIERTSLPWKAPLQPFLAYFGICFCSIVAFFNGFDCFFPGSFSARTFVPPYIDIPIFLGLFLGYKIIKKTKIVKLGEMDLWSGKAEIDRLEPHWPNQKAKKLVGENLVLDCVVMNAREIVLVLLNITFNEPAARWPHCVRQNHEPLRTCRLVLT